MDQQWSTYAESPVSNRQRYVPQTMTTPQHTQRDPTVPSQIKQEQYAKQEAYASPTAAPRTNSMPLASPGGPQSAKPEFNDGDGDVAMEDADPYKPKYGAARPNHQHRHSQQFLQQEESAAARRYSPMNLSPTSPYSGSTQQGGQQYTSFTPGSQSNRQSPTRTNPYMSPPNSYYSPPSKYSLRQYHIQISAGLLIDPSCSFSATCTPTPSPTIEHEPGDFLPAICDRTPRCSVQQRRAVAAHDQPKSSPVTANRARLGAKVPESRKYGRTRAHNQCATPFSPGGSRWWFY